MHRDHLVKMWVAGYEGPHKPLSAALKWIGSLICKEVFRLPKFYQGV